RRLRGEAYGDQIDPGGADPMGEAGYLGAFAGVERAERVFSAGHRPHLHDQARGSLAGEDVELAGTDGDVASQDLDPVSLQEAGRHHLSCPSEAAAVFAHSSSGRDSSSMLMSLKVRTLTLLRKRAGRNMSQTQASSITTSKYRASPSV